MGRIDLSESEIIEVMNDFLNGKGKAHDWDDFISIPIKDPSLDKIRKECLAIPDKFPPLSADQWCAPEGINRIKEILNLLSADNFKNEKA